MYLKNLLFKKRFSELNKNKPLPKMSFDKSQLTEEQKYWFDQAVYWGRINMTSNATAETREEERMAKIKMVEACEKKRQNK